MKVILPVISYSFEVEGSDLLPVATVHLELKVEDALQIKKLTNFANQKGNERVKSISIIHKEYKLFDALSREVFPDETLTIEIDKNSFYVKAESKNIPGSFFETEVRYVTDLLAELREQSKRS